MKGSCACGAVGYEIDRIDLPVSHCHCQSCRKTHAAAFVTTAGVLREHFHWTRGQEKLSNYESSPGKLRRFCSLCGCHLVAERDGAAAVIVRIATLDEARAIARNTISGLSMMSHGLKMKTLRSTRNGSRGARASVALFNFYQGDNR